MRETKMVKQTLRLLAVLSLLISPAAMANVIVNPSLFYYSNVANQSEDFEVDSSAIGLQFHAGYRLEFGLSLGVNYFTIMEKQKVSGAQTFELDYTPTGIGLSVGYMTGKDNHNFAANLHYYFQAEMTEGSNDDEYKYHGDSGFGFDLAYYFGISNSVHVGPKLSYTQFNYSKVDDPNSGETVDLSDVGDGDWNNTWTTIGLSLLLRF